MGQVLRANPAARLVAAALSLGTVQFGTAHAGAAETTAYAPYQIETTGDHGVRLSSTNSDVWYALTIGGTNANVSQGGQSLQPGETWRRSLQAEMQGKIGSILTMDLHSRFTEAARDADDSLFALQSVEGKGQRGALQDYQLSTHFYGGRVTFDSSHRVSTLAELDPGAHGVNGAAESENISASLWRNDFVDFSVSGGYDSMDANYADIDTTSADTSLKDKQRFRYGTKLQVGKVGVFANQTSESAVSDTAAPRQSQLETGVSLKLSDWRNEKLAFFHPLLAIFPDSVWASISRGEQHQIENGAPDSGEIEKTSFGADRNWKRGGLNLNLWQMTISTPPAVREGSQWHDEGVSAGGNFRTGPWTLSGNMSWTRDDNIALLNNTAESTLNGSVFVTWQGPDLPKLSAGVMNYGYEQQFFDLGGLNRNGSMRYQVALDLSPWLASAHNDTNTQLSLLASVQDNSNASLWGETGHNETVGREFFGFRLIRPLH